ncbi:MAG: DUF2284 domain-containing protein [Bacteroidales bacterium]|nr:DUF2284 domain-containing protein [Bacteroidales bacterium]
MVRKEKLNTIFKNLGLIDYKWINSSDIIVSTWVRVKCTFGCSDYGLSVCPPNVPSVKECRDFFGEYSSVVLFRFNFVADKENYPEDYSKEITKGLLDLEREVFLEGFPKVFVLNQTCCGLCSGCVKNRIDCKNLSKSRPSPEAFAIDVFSTIKKAGFEINVIKTTHQEINRYAVLMIE